MGRIGPPGGVGLPGSPGMPGVEGKSGPRGEPVSMRMEDADRFVSSR